MLRTIAALTVATALGAFVACGGHAPDVQKVPASGGTPHKATTVGSASGSGSGAVSLPDVGCIAPSCAFHAGAAAYFTCLAGGAGACFHFGGPCTPSDSCMYDPKDRTYKQCQRAVEGTCAQWAAACAPTSACMFDPDDGLHHHCDEAAAGACRKYGALCAP